MINHKLIISAILVLLLLPVQLAYSFNTRFFVDTPVGHMTETEIETMKYAFYSILDSEDVNVKKKWMGESDNVGGILKAGKIFTREGLQCRKVSYRNRAGGIKKEATLTFCKNREGEWKVAP